MTIDERIYKQAKVGTGNNPGVSDTLASLIVAQAKHETGNYTHRFFKEFNNAFGYSYFAGSPYQSGPGPIADNKKAIAAFYTVEDSVKELIDWLYRRYREGRLPALNTIATPEQYAAALKGAGYYGDTVANYTRGLKAFFFPVKVAAAGTGLLIIVSAIIYFLYKK